MGLMVFIMFVGACVSGLVAANKNRNAAGWAVAGALLPLISMLILVASPALAGPGETSQGY